MYGQIPSSTRVPDVDAKALSSLGFEFESTTPISRGAYGLVFMGRCNEFARRKPQPIDWEEEDVKREREEVSLEGQPCAIKLCLIQSFGNSANQKELLYTEAQRLEELRHPCIAEVYLVFRSGPHRIGPLPTHLSSTRVYFVMEYMNAGTLNQRMSLGRAAFNQSDAIQVMIQLTAGLHYLHSQGVSHNDFHTNNIMFLRDDQNNYHCKIVDMGSTRPLIPGTRTRYDDIMLYSSHIVMILSKSDFTNKQLLKKLREFTDWIIMERISDMEDIENELFSIVGEYAEERVVRESSSAEMASTSAIGGTTDSGTTQLASSPKKQSRWERLKEYF